MSDAIVFRRAGSSPGLRNKNESMHSILEVDCSDQHWLIAEWPDGTWCDITEIREMSHMSDDYQVLRVLSHDEGYTPIKTERWSAQRK